LCRGQADEDEDVDMDMSLFETTFCIDEPESDMEIPERSMIDDEVTEERRFWVLYNTECARRLKEATAIAPQAWTDLAAIQRFQALLNTFDDQRFSRSIPLTFYSIPWPLLGYPEALQTEDIQTDAIERFFDRFKFYRGMQEHKEVLRKARLLFHPDRWTARHLYDAVPDDRLASGLMVAVGDVAKSVGNLVSALTED
jgi:hypothetical protein